MTSIRGNWVGSMLSSLAVGVVLAGPIPVRAQGFGPDPFRPYNSQYDAYTYPLGQNGADAAMQRMGNRNANQFQDFLNDLQGPTRGAAGTPYFRSAVDPSFSQKFRDDREYRPNRKADPSFEETQQQLSEKYFAFFEEKDPKKRARLVRDYTLARRPATRALSTRRVNPERILDAASRRDSETVSDGTVGRRSADLPLAQYPARRSGARREAPAGSLLGGSDSARAGGSRTGSVPPPPALPFERSPRSSSRRTPTDVLKRARTLDPGSGAPTGGTTAPDARSLRRTPAPTLPGLTDDIP